MTTAIHSASVELRDIHVSFGTLEVLRGVDLKVEQGEFFGLLGPNHKNTGLGRSQIGRYHGQDSGEVLRGNAARLQLFPDQIGQVLPGGEPDHTLCPDPHAIRTLEQEIPG